MSLNPNLYSTPAGAIYFVKGRDGYLFDRNNPKAPRFVGLEARQHALRLTLAQAEKVAKLCSDAGFPCDVTTV